MTLKYDDITTLYQKRWKVEEYHKSLKQNASWQISNSYSGNQTNHFFSALYAFVKLEVLTMKTFLNHFALKSKIYVSALKIAFEELKKFKITYITA